LLDERGVDLSNMGCRKRRRNDSAADAMRIGIGLPNRGSRKRDLTVEFGFFVKSGSNIGDGEIKVWVVDVEFVGTDSDDADLLSIRWINPI
jgi:hypothetical protein